MGGKNAIVVDGDADLDVAVPAIVQSAFGYAGQKCSAASRLVVVERVHDQLVERLVGAARELRVGHPRDMAVTVGPLIDADAYERVRSYVTLAGDDGEVVLARDDVPGEGWFVGPTIVTDVGLDSRLATEEVFGPLLCVSGRPTSTTPSPSPTPPTTPSRPASSRARRRTSRARRPSCGRATCMSTAPSPALSSGASRSVGTACPESGRRPAGPTTSCSSWTRER
jgi:hypothetical protein